MRPGSGWGRSTRSARPGWTGAAASLLLHAAILWLLVPHGAGRQGVDLADPPLIEIEMIDQAAQTKGQPAPNPGQSPPPPPEQTPPPPPEAKADPVPPPAPPPPPAPAAQAAAPAVNLGDSDMDQDPLRVTGANVVPPRPDAVFRNKPPGYPIEAARRRHEGVVAIRARINTGGVPDQVVVARSSGDASLDRAARQAVELWRFTPARDKGVAVPFDYEVNIAFKIDGAPP